MFGKRARTLADEEEEGSDDEVVAYLRIDLPADTTGRGRRDIGADLLEHCRRLLLHPTSRALGASRADMTLVHKAVLFRDFASYGHSEDLFDVLDVSC